MKNATKSVRSLARKTRLKYEATLLFLRRKARVIKRVISKEKPTNSYHLAIVTVKRPAYAALAIENINSLHYLNSSHQFSLYCDDICESEFINLFGRLDYPKQVKIINKFKDTNQPWQYSKLDTTIEISRKGFLLVDADAIWHDDLTIDSDKITLLVSPKKINEKPDEVAIILNLFDKPEWLKFRYYSSGFISIPSKYMTEQVATDARNYLETIIRSPLQFIVSEKDRGDQKRQAEQFALNLALLSNHGEEVMTTLKEKDETKDTNLLQSLYYGCERQIND